MQFCQSNGSTVVRNALLSYDFEKRKRVALIAIAPSSFISPDICRSVRHLCSKNDFIYMFDIIGQITCHKTIRYLDRHPNASFFDHDFQSPTYEKPAKEFYKEFINTKGFNL
jgi:hypothetical protein